MNKSQIHTIIGLLGLIAAFTATADDFKIAAFILMTGAVFHLALAVWHMDTVDKQLAEPDQPGDTEVALSELRNAMDGAADGCGIIEAVRLIISQRDNARVRAEVFQRKLKELGYEYV